MKKTTAFLLLVVATFVFTSNAYAFGYKYIDSYQKKDGSYVSGHFRSEPDAYEWNNLNY